MNDSRKRSTAFDDKQTYYDHQKQNKELTLVSQEIDGLHPEIEGRRGNIVMYGVMNPKKSVDAVPSAEWSGRRMQVMCEQTKQWCEESHHFLLSLSHCTLHYSLECSARDLIVTKSHTLASICGCLVARVCVALR